MRYARTILYEFFDKYDYVEPFRPRLVKIPQREIPEKRAFSDVDFHRFKSRPDIKCEKRQIETDTSEKKLAGWRLNKVRCVVLKLIFYISGSPIEEH